MGRSRRRHYEGRSRFKPHWPKHIVQNPRQGLLARKLRVSMAGAGPKHDDAASSHNGISNPLGWQAGVHSSMAENWRPDFEDKGMARVYSALSCFSGGHPSRPRNPFPHPSASPTL